jgi:uncharacterized protein
LNFYLDTNAIIPLFIAEARTSAIGEWFENLRERPALSDLAHAEFGAAVARRVRMGELDDAGAAAIFAAFDLWAEQQVVRVATEPADIRTAAHLVRIPYPKLLSPDAVHIATCRRLGVILVSDDAALLDVAAREGVGAARPDRR